MNKDLLLKTALWLEAGAPERTFNMGKMLDYDDKPTNNWCDTVCCIAGYVWQQAHTPDEIPDHLYLFWDTIERQAADILGLDFATAHKLFYPRSEDSHRSYNGDWETITPAQAAQAVRNVMTRGKAYWEEILEFDE